MRSLVIVLRSFEIDAEELVEYIGVFILVLAKEFGQQNLCAYNSVLLMGGGGESF